MTSLFSQPVFESSRSSCSTRAGWPGRSPEPLPSSGPGYRVSSVPRSRRLRRRCRKLPQFAGTLHGHGALQTPPDEEEIPGLGKTGGQFTLLTTSPSAPCRRASRSAARVSAVPLRHRDAPRANRTRNRSGCREASGKQCKRRMQTAPFPIEAREQSFRLSVHPHMTEKGGPFGPPFASVSTS